MPDPLSERGEAETVLSAREMMPGTPSQLLEQRVFFREVGALVGRRVGVDQRVFGNRIRFGMCTARRCPAELFLVSSRSSALHTQQKGPRGDGGSIEAQALRNLAHPNIVDLSRGLNPISAAERTLDPTSCHGGS